MIDVVYTLSTESRFDDLEFRYSLRSLQNLKELGNIYIIGHRPRWVDNVIHIPCFDAYQQNKDGNLISKLILACFQRELSDKFLWFSDDQVLINKVPREVFRLPTTANQHIEFEKITTKLNKWQSRLKRTVEILRQRGHAQQCFEAHIPYLLDKEKYPKTLLQYDYGNDIGYCGNTLYFNSINEPGIDNINSVLLRLVEKPGSVESLIEQSSQKYFLNYSDSAINDILFNFLQQRFPQKSKYEL